MTTLTSVPLFKIDRPNYEDGAGPDLTLIPPTNLPTYVKDATFTCTNGEVHWFTVQKCPAQGVGTVMWSLQANITIDVVSPTYTFALTVGGDLRTSMQLTTDIVTGNFTIDQDDDSYNANFFVSILAHQPNSLLLQLDRKGMIPIDSMPAVLSLNLHFR